MRGWDVPEVSPHPRRCLVCDEPVLLARDLDGELLVLADGRNRRPPAKGDRLFLLEGALAAPWTAPLPRRLVGHAYHEHRCQEQIERPARRRRVAVPS